MSTQSVVPVLMYHHVSPSPGAITASPENFEDQRWLSRNAYTSLTASEFAGHLAGAQVPKRSVLITFDDGYLDNWVYAYPLLKKYGFKAVVFLVTSWIHDGPVRPHSGQANVLPETPEHKECERRIDAGRSDDVILRWSEIRAMQAEGVVEFHSHTHTHTRWDLVDAANKNRHIQEELEASRRSLETHLGSVQPHFCWPQGYFDPEYVALAKAQGFKYLYTTHAFGQNVPGTDPAHIYRFAVRNTTGVSVGRRIKIAAHPLIGPLFNRWKLWTRARRSKK